MPDREKVIKGLETCNKYGYECPECPYHDPEDTECHSEELFADAIALIKEQEEKIRQMPKPDQHEKKKTMLDEYLERPTEKAKRVADVISLQVQDEIERTKMLGF